MLFFRRHRTGLAITGLACIVALLVFLRRPDVLLNSQFWAEDGIVFFSSQVSYGFLHSITTPYAGYLHTIPRLIAVATAFVPVRWMPLAFNICSLATVSFCLTAFSWPCFRPLIASDSLRAAACLVSASAIPAGGELILSICNLQTFLGVLALLLIYRNSDNNFSADRRTRIEVPLAVLLILICLTAPATLLLVPFLIWQSIRNHGWRRVIPLLAICALLLQAYVIHKSQEGKLNLNFNALFLATIAGGVSRSILAPILGHQYLLLDTVRSLVVKLLLAFALCIVMITALVVSANREQRRILLSALYVGTASLTLALAGRNLAGSFLTIDGIQHAQGERYFLLPACIFIFILALAVERWLRPIGHWAMFAILPAAFCMGIMQNFKIPPLDDLAWPASAAKIAAWQQALGRHENVGPITVPVNPPNNGMTLLPRE